MTDLLRSLIIKYSQQGKYQVGEHIILILDKFAQQIPWESIPSLRGKPVSRLPSVLFLIDRINSINNINNSDNDDIQFPIIKSSPKFNIIGKRSIKNSSLRNNSEKLKDGVYLDSSNLYYILNPEGDLNRTQSIFGNILK